MSFCRLGENQFLLVGIKPFLKNNGFPLISVTVSTCWKKKDWIKENGFHRTENASPRCGLEDSFKNAFPLDRKYLSLEGVSEKWEKVISTSYKNSFQKQDLPPPNFKSFNKAMKKYSFGYTENLCPLAGMKNLLKNTFQLDGKAVSTAWNIWQIENTVFY